MEFLGSFYRTRLRGEKLGEEELIADFSVNAVRRLGLTEGGALTVELPADRLLVFPQRGEDDRRR
jgi:iron(III) transport system ATP-binding protein